MAQKPRGPKPIGELVRPALDPVVATRGLTQASLLLDWESIAGERLATLCQPVRLQWPPRGPKSDPARAEPATLWLRVASGRGLDVQYQAAALVERVNAHFGWRCVARISVRPEPMRPRARDESKRVPDAAITARIRAQVGDLGNPELEAAITRLGAEVLTERARRPSKGEQK